MPANNGTEAYRRPAHLVGQDQPESESFMATAGELKERAGEAASDFVALVKQNPITTIAIAAGLAFAFGALWKAGRPTRQSQLEALMARLPELPSANRLRSYWR